MAILYMIVKEESGPYVKASFFNRMGLQLLQSATHALKIFKTQKRKTWNSQSISMASWRAVFVKREDLKNW